MGSSHPPSLSNVATPPPKKTGAYNAVFTHFAQNLRIFFLGGGGRWREGKGVISLLNSIVVPKRARTVT